MKPWFYETTEPALFNEWTWSHFFWGLLSASTVRSDVTAIGAHTVYEMIEGWIFPWEYRDISMLNHIGDTVAFIAGRIAGVAAK